MINAERARRITVEAISEKMQAQMEDVEKLILYTAQHSQFSCQIKYTIMPQVAACLKEMGYSIKNNKVCNGYWTTISWSEA